MKDICEFWCCNHPSLSHGISGQIQCEVLAQRLKQRIIIYSQMKTNIQKVSTQTTKSPFIAFLILNFVDNVYKSNFSPNERSCMSRVKRQKSRNVVVFGRECSSQLCLWPYSHNFHGYLGPSEVHVTAKARRCPIFQKKKNKTMFRK